MPATLKRALLGLLALAILAAAILWLALGSERVQRAALGRVSAALEERFGLTLSARELRFRPASGRLEAAGVAVQDLAGRPVVAIDGVTAQVRMRPLLRGRLELPTVVLERPRLDLARLTPPAEDEPVDAGPPTVPPVEIGELRIRGGELVGLPAPDPLAEWSWSGEVGQIEVAAALREGRLEAELTRATTTLLRGGSDRMELELSGRVAGPLAGPYEIADARAQGADLDLDLGGSFGVAEDQPARLSFDVRADVGRLLAADLSGPLTASGEIDLRAGGGRLTFDAPALPAELGAGWLEPELFATLEAAGTTLALTGNLELGPGGLDRVRGDLGARWRRGDVSLAEIDLEPEVAGLDGGARVPFELRLVPELEGRLRAEGALAIAHLDAPTDIEIEAGKVDVRLPEIERTLAELAGLWPDLAAAVPVDPRGAVELGGSVAGVLGSPRVELDASWRSGGGDLLLSLSGEPLGGRGRLSLEADRFPLAAVGAGLEGGFAGRAKLELDGGRPAGTFDLEVTGASVGELDGLGVGAVGKLGARVLHLTDLTAEWPEHRSRFEGRIEQTEDGVRVVAERLTVDGLDGEVTADIPAVMLDALPAAAWLFGPEGGWRSAASRRNRARLAWRLPESDLAPVAGLGPARLEVGTFGELVVDLDRPAASGGEMTLSTLLWNDGDRGVEALEPIELRLADGRLAADGMRLAAGEARARIDLELGLRDGWRMGDPYETLLAEAGAELRLELDEPGSELEGRVAVRLASDWTLAEWGDAIADLEAAARGSVSAGWLGSLVGATSAGGRLSADLALAGTPSALTGSFSIDGAEASWELGEGESLRLEALGLEGRFEEGSLSLSRLGARVNGEPLEGSGQARLADGRIEIERLDLTFAGLESRWSAGIPIDGEGDVDVEWRMAETDLGPLLGLFDLIRPGDSLRAGSSGLLRVPLDAAASIDGVIEISGLEWASGTIRTRSDGPIRLDARDGRLRLEPVRLRSGLQIFDLRGSADLVDTWRWGDEPLELIGELDVTGDGTLPASMLHPFLAGAVAEGYLGLRLEVAGAPDELRVALRADGSEAQVILARPYAARISSPRLELMLDPGGPARLEGELELNEGRVVLSGGDVDGGLQLGAEVEGARFRLDYGLLALVDSTLLLSEAPEEGWTLGGTVKVRSGVLTRDIELDLDLVRDFLAPVDLTSTEASALEAIALDLDLTTAEGVRVKNNLADLVVRWDPVRIEGTLAAPVVGGRFEVDPGGRVRALGQTVRIDSGSLDYPGVADLPATLELEVTSSFEDPSIATLEGEDPFAGRATDEEGEANRLAAAAAGVGSFLGERIASGLTGATVSLEPVLIFGEADPGARLTVSQAFSPQVSLAASIDLRNAEAQTYLLDLHGLEAVPGLNSQVFTTDAASEGVALRQRVKLGPGGAPRAVGPKIRKLTFDLPDGVSRRRLKRSLGLRKGDRLIDGGRFAAEVEAAEFLRRRGYVDARASVQELQVEGGVELAISARPGPRVRFDFRGEKLSAALRRTVADLYRTDYYEAAAIEEMKAEARRALRSLGFLDPGVEVQVEPLDPQRPEGDRAVIVSMTGGERIELERVRFTPLPPEEAALLETRFALPVRRIELAAGVADADRRVEETLRLLGYPEARVVGRRLSADGSELEVELALGDRPRVASIEVTGVAPEEARRLASRVELAPGDPVRSDRVAVSALAIRDELRSRGFSDARVAPRVESAAAGEDARDLHFEVEPGVSYFVGEVTFSGLRSTRRGFAARVADLDEERDYSRQDLLEARRRLARTGLFESVTPEVDRAPGGAVRVDFGVRERRRFELAYGLRWDSEDDTAVLVEVIDRNSLGRAWTLGLRAQWAQDDESVRIFTGLPRLFDARSSLGLFGAVREEIEAGLITTSIQATVQLGYELGRRLTARLYGRLTDNRVTEEEPADPRNPFDRRVTLPVIGTQLLYDARRGRSLAERGLLATADLSVSDAAIGSDFGFARFFGQASYLRRVGGGSRPLTWAQSFRLGLARPFDPEMIRQERFFAGGEYSVRGYAKESLGPRERLGLATRPAGGQSLLILNQELRYRFAESFAAVLFVDGGNVWADRSDLGLDLVWSTGLGLRALTPLGLLRLDLAHALDRRPFDPEYKLYLGFGNTF